MTALARGEEIIGILETAGIRATADPNALAPPCVLVPPPNRVFDLGCGSTLNWQLVALATSTVSADRESWSQLEDLLTDIVPLLDIQTATLVSYAANGKQYPAYILAMREAE